MALDLTLPRQVLEGLMDDTIRLEADPEFEQNKTMDPHTLVLEGPTPSDLVEVYEGKARVSPQRASRYATQAGQVYTEGDYRIAVPWSVTGAEPGQKATVLTSLRDPALVGKVFTVKEVRVRTLLLQRTLVCELRD